jgi:hypothetical protein
MGVGFDNVVEVLFSWFVWVVVFHLLLEVVFPVGLGTSDG